MFYRTLTLVCALALTGAASPPPPGTERLEGPWRNTKNTVHLIVKPCGKSLCGTVTWAGEKQRKAAKEGSGRDLIGTNLLTDIKPDGNGKWRGKIYVPDINTHASATLVRVSDISIRVTGCTLFGIICKSQHWHRLD